MTFAEIDAARTPLEERFASEIENALLDEGEQLAGLIEEQTFPLSAFLESKVGAVLNDLWTAAIVKFADMSATKAAEDWVSVVQHFIETEGGLLITAINETTLNLVRTILEHGVAEGQSVQEIARNLRREWPEISKVRGMRISRTEVLRASNHGSLEGARQAAELSGLELEKVWLTAPPTGTERDRHALYPGLNGQRRKMNELFDVGGHAAMYPGDAILPASESIQCRCAMTYEPVAKSFTARRDERIRRDYPALREQWGYVQAMEELGEREGLSAHTVRDIIYKR